MRLSRVHRILVIFITVLCGFTAYGVPSTRYAGTANNNHLHLGLEWQSMKGLSGYYNNARFRDVLLAGMFYQQDPLAEKYYPLSPYHYGACNPLLNLDFNGMDWYSYNTVIHLENGETINKTEYSYTDYTSQEALTNAGIKGNYLGKAVVVFNGSMNEKLGEGENLYGEGAVLADVTVYGPNGKDDIRNYQGFTLTSNFKKFGAIDNGVYNVSYVSPGKSGALSSNYVLNNGGPVNCLYGENRSPKEYLPYSLTQKNGIYIHRSNNNGWAGDNYIKKTAVSTGCLLILPKDWEKFCNQIGKNNFTLILNRK